MEGVPNIAAKEQISRAKPCSTELLRVHVRPGVVLYSPSWDELRAPYPQLLNAGTNSLS